MVRDGVPNAWTRDEMRFLRAGVKKFGEGEWTKILEHPDFRFKSRTPSELARMWSASTTAERKSEPRTKPNPVTARIVSADAPNADALSREDRKVAAVMKTFQRLEERKRKRKEEAAGDDANSTAETAAVSTPMQVPATPEEAAPEVPRFESEPEEKDVKVAVRPVTVAPVRKPKLVMRKPGIPGQKPGTPGRKPGTPGRKPKGAPLRGRPPNSVRLANAAAAAPAPAPAPNPVGRRPPLQRNEPPPRKPRVKTEGDEVRDRDRKRKRGSPDGRTLLLDGMVPDATSESDASDEDDMPPRKVQRSSGDHDGVRSTSGPATPSSACDDPNLPLSAKLGKKRWILRAAQEMDAARALLEAAATQPKAEPTEPVVKTEMDENAPAPMAI